MTMTVTQYYPWARQQRLENEIKNVFDHFFGNPENAEGGMAADHWTPRVDIHEEEKRFVILADVPGVDPKDIEVNMDGGTLTIKGERKAEAKEGKGAASRIERFRGIFQRQFVLPDSADAEGITASGKHGVLEVSIPKKAVSVSRRIEVVH
jgi:HSP20 family protein